MPPRPLMAGGCERAAVFPACRRLCTCATMGSRPVKNGLRRNGTFQVGTWPIPIEVAPAVLDGLTKGLGQILSGQIIDGLADALHHIFKCVIMAGPPGDGLAI